MSARHAPERISAAEARALMAHAPKSKFHNKRVRNRADGEVFDSQGETARYDALRLRERAGEISGLRRQVRFQLTVEMPPLPRVLICEYVADFTYRERGAARDTVEDFKGFRTREYIAKRRLMLACHGVVILETGKENGRRAGKRRRPKIAKSKTHQGGQDA